MENKYRFGASVLLEIVSIVQDGFMKGEDISQRLRDLVLEEEVGADNPFDDLKVLKVVKGTEAV